MHFCYVDEAGCTGLDLANDEQPIFVCGGIIVRDEGWNLTQERFVALISEYFGGTTPANFELHSCELLSPNGEGFFTGHDRNRRNQLAINLLSLIGLRSHGIFSIAIDKRRLAGIDISAINNKEHLQLKAPYLIAFDYIITLLNWYIKNRLGSTARALLIIDKKEIFHRQIESITYHRRYHNTISKRVKRITEFSYPIDSQKNPMIQLSDLVCFVTKKFLEVENGYRDGYPVVAKNFYKDLYRIIDGCLIRRELLLEDGRGSDAFNTYMNGIISSPRTRWKTINY